MLLTNKLSKKIVIMDGAMGTELWRSLDLPYKKPFSDSSLNISNPGIVEEIHTRYLDAGADVITTNTFTDNLLLQTYYGKESEISEQNERGVQIARYAVDRHYKKTEKQVFVGANIWPLPVFSDILAKSHC